MSYKPLTSEERIIRNAIEADSEKTIISDYFDLANRRVYRAVESENIEGYSKATYQKWITYVNPENPEDFRVKSTFEAITTVVEEE